MSSDNHSVKSIPKLKLPNKVIELVRETSYLESAIPFVAFQALRP